MPFREFVARVALGDARRFEIESAQELREIMAGCEDARTCAVLEEIVRQEEEHLAHLDEELERLRGKPAPATRPAIEPLPTPPPRQKLTGTTCEKLKRLLKKEEGSATFYSILAERTLIPAVRGVFRHLGDEERGHAEALAKLIAEICGNDATGPQ